jgi:hypothetical protein
MKRQVCKEGQVMSITLHLFFAGLIAFVPSQDGRELFVLVPDAGHGHAISDGSSLEPHRALLVARAAGCQGDCEAGNSEIAGLLFADEPDAKRPGELMDAIRRGTAWQLEGVELSISSQDGQLKIHPGFSSVADLNRIVPGAGFVDPALLAPQPPAGKLATRLRLQSGEVSAYRLVEEVDGSVPSLRFKTLKDGKDAAPGYMQPLATWVMAEIKIPGNAVEVVARAFGKGGERRVKLSPDDHGIVEIVVMNVPVTRSTQEAGGPGKHFEIYYNLARTMPATRPVPYVVKPSGDSGSVESKQEAPASKLLDALRLGNSRGVYDRLICPLAQLSDGGDRQP